MNFYSRILKRLFDFLLSEEFNRSHDKEYHRVKKFIPDSELKKKF